MTKAAVIAILPCGLVTGGVTSWTVRLLNALAPERSCGLILHAPAKGVAPARIELDSRIRVFDLSGMKRLEEANGDVDEFAAAYGDVVAELAGDGCAVLLPSLLGDCYGACAQVTREEDLNVRVVGFAHSDNAYDVRVIEHYEGMLSNAAGVSAALTRILREKWGERANDVRQIATGVEVGVVRSSRPNGAPLRLAYTGRMDESVKRVTALIAMSDELTKRGVAHELTLVGDGPAETELDRMISARRTSSLQRIVRTGGVTPDRVRETLRTSDVFVLASRYEGLSVSMLEAMSEGCCCVVTRVNSGAEEAIEDGVNGVLVSCDDGMDVVGRAFADRIATLTREQISKIGHAARATVIARYSMESHAKAVGRLLDEAASKPARSWPADRRAAFTSAPGIVGSGTVPAGADNLLREVMDSLRGKNVVVHGTGRHSMELSHVLREYLAQIGAFVDEDPQKRGSAFLGKPVLGPDVVAKIGATDVVISSHLHQDAIWSRRDVYERQGLRVHRLYAS